MPGKKVPECHSGSRPSEKELTERRSGTFPHKKALQVPYIHAYFPVSQGNAIHNRVCNFI
jgi:hypothetical protein